MALFAHRFLTRVGPEAAIPDGRYDEALALLVDDAGVPIVETRGTMPTRGDRDRPHLLATTTKAERDRDGIAAELVTKPAGERAKDAAVWQSLWGPPPE